MALFSYIAKTREGKNIKNVGEFFSREELIRKLKEKGLFIISVKELHEKPFLTSSALFKRKKGHAGIKLLDLTFFARNLATTLSAGVPLLRSLEVIAAQTDSSKLSVTLKNIINEVKRGLSLSEAIATHPRIFSSLWRGIMEVGEATGNLPFVLDKLAAYLEMRLDFERRVKSALIYPVILLIAGVIAVFIFFQFILPKFTNLFDQFNIVLPLLTQILFNISKFMNRYFFLVIGGMVGLVVLGLWARKKPGTTRLLDKISLQLPLLSDVTVLTCLERFASTMYILLESGVPIVYTLEVVAKSIGNSVLGEKIITIKENVKRGKSLSSEIVKVQFFPSLITEIVNIGEEAGNLSEMFKKISTHYQKDLFTKVDRLVSVFEPLMIVFMGVVIGTIVISLFLPLFKISTMGG